MVQVVKSDRPHTKSSLEKEIRRWKWELEFEQRKQILSIKQLLKVLSAITT